MAFKAQKMKERSFQTTFSHWLKNVHRKTGAFELKVAKNESLPFSAVADHQLQALENVRYGTFVFKIIDAGYQNPFDCFCLTRQPAWIVIKYEKFFCLITIDTFLLEKERSVRKSLTAVRAREIAVEVIHS